MANFAVIDNQVVINIIDAPSKEVAEEATKFTCVEYNDENPARIGWTYDGDKFTDPASLSED